MLKLVLHAGAAAGAVAIALGVAGSASGASGEDHSLLVRDDAHRAIASEQSALEGSVLFVALRIDHFYIPTSQYEADITVELSAFVDEVVVTIPNGEEGKLKYHFEDDTHWWSASGYLDTFADVQDVAHGTWMISIYDDGNLLSASTFTVDANAMQESDFFPPPDVLSPVQDEVNVSPCAVFSWTDTTGDVEADVLAVGVTDEHFTFEQGAWSVHGEIDIAATSWQPPQPLLHGVNEFGVAYGVFDDTLVGPLQVTSGSMIWGPLEWAPPNYPESKPVFLTASETLISFHVAGDCPGNPADLNGDGVVDVDDLLIVLNNWGPCPDDIPGCLGDTNMSGQVNVDDLLTVLNNWG